MKRMMIACAVVILAFSCLAVCVPTGSDSSAQQVTEISQVDMTGYDEFVYVHYVVESCPDGYRVPVDTYVMQGERVPVGNQLDGYRMHVLVNGEETEGPIYAGETDMTVTIAFSQDHGHLAVPTLVLAAIGISINLAAVFIKRMG